MSRSEGSVKATPAAMDSPADPAVWTMLFSRMVALPKKRKMVIDRTAMGIDAETVSPTLSARYTEEAAKTTPRTEPRTTARSVSSAGVLLALMYGENVLPPAAAV